MVDFLYAEVQKNFVDIYFLNGDRVEHRQLRATLASMLADAKDKSIFQCHRSFIVNLNRIFSAHGNSNGYQLTVGDGHHVVPVSIIQKGICQHARYPLIHTASALLLTEGGRGLVD